MVDEAVLVVAFNRPSCLERLLDQLSTQQIERLYVSIDGPREGYPDDESLVQSCRELVDSIDWVKEIRTQFNETNLGCGLGVSSAISWFFTFENRGIILEDDVLPNSSFFTFCETLLDRYQDDDRVFAISGCNVVPATKQSCPEMPYRFSQFPHIWGWATWRSRWLEHNLDMSDWRGSLPLRQLWIRVNRSLTGLVYWIVTFDRIARGAVDTWDGQLALASMTSGRLVATSNINLVENIGFGDDATHTRESVGNFIPVGSIALPLTLVPISVDTKADRWMLEYHYGARPLGFLRKGYKLFRSRLIGAKPKRPTGG